MFNKISFLLIILTLLDSSCNLELKQNTISYEFFAGENRRNTYQMDGQNLKGKTNHHG